MARPLSHTPAHVDHRTAQRQVDDFVAALDESGLLRALTGAIRAHPELAAQVTGRIDPDDATAMAALAGLLEVPDPDAARRLVRATRAGRAAADDALTTAEPPTWLELVRRLHDADVRRGVGAVLAGLRAFGRVMSRPA
ncbi:DUF1641 domain-containing protein [Salsipaludibacter albus]|uniref:DUF1641 domain-containing protein n=1 Tax=Salsipaludibacter albus TaxID=2849650 RepID=UPI001EE4CBDA|nr:DUF1641 domain-containing protein [Salsipaludibacter albus]MBY5161355.1 DUF1641 domain-containing protein [Salsipaludibacter albus]